MVGTGELEASGVKVMRPEVFAEVLRDRRRLLEVDLIIVYKADKV